MDWTRRADPAFYAMEPYVLRTEAQVPRYSDEAQAEARFDALRTDWILFAALVVGTAALLFATGFDALVTGAALPAAASAVFARDWRSQPQLLAWGLLATFLAAFAYAFAFEAPALAARVPLEITAAAIAYLAVCVVAGRIRRAELAARPEGLVSLPQSIVPLFDRSHHHAVICWRE
ncbi:MAG: hypothetical protein JO140_02500 [Candidatus Eremiobacteraeota bacterium]|nr:hypothetical protein [Candidatus Eremiobacteraeota bacterium]